MHHAASRPRRSTALIAALAVVIAVPLVTASSASAGTSDTVTYEVPESSRYDLGVDTSLLDPGTIGACNAGFGDVSVASWETGIGHVDLFCGDGRSGYVHIRNDHQLDWQNVVDSAGGGANGDDFMVFATGSIVTAPAPGFPKDAGAGKLCYTAPIQIRDRDGNVVDTYHPTVLVSANNKRIITAHPTHVVDDCG